MNRQYIVSEKSRGMRRRAIARRVPLAAALAVGGGLLYLHYGILRPLLHQMEGAASEGMREAVREWAGEI